MKKPLSLYLSAALPLIFACACTQQPAQEPVPEPPARQAPEVPAETASLAPEGSIKGPCAVFYSPDEARIAALKKEMGEDDFYTVADDNMYYMSETRDFYTKRGVNIIEAEAPELVFCSEDGRVFRVNTAAEEAPWGVFVFDGKKAPVSAEVVSPEVTYEAYFGK